VDEDTDVKECDTGETAETAETDGGGGGGGGNGGGAELDVVVTATASKGEYHQQYLAHTAMATTSHSNRP
jgi:hypothetical protein